MEVLASKKKYEIRLDNAINCIEIEYNDIISVKEFKKILGKVYDYSVKHRVTKLLTNMNKMGMIPMEVQKWIGSEWYPKMMQNGTTIFAQVEAKSTAAQASTDDLSDKVKSDRSQSGFFTSLDEARKWIAAQ